jgi:Spy/CpxP family protein refolding chaperone
LRKVLFIILALALVAGATAAFAEDNPPPPPPPPGGPGGMMAGGGMAMRGGGMGMGCPAMAVAPPQAAMIERMGDQLALTDDQKTKLTAALTKSEDALKELRQKGAKGCKALQDAVLAPTYDAAKVAQLLADAKTIEASIADSEIKTWTEIRGILTADQLAKLSAAMSRRMGGNQQGNRQGNRGRRNQPDGAPAETPPAQ